MNEHPLNALPQGYRLQEYEFVRVLGFGGFGVTYLGFDHNLDKAVAIKEYQPSDIATRTDNQSIVPKASTFREGFDWGLERFLDEARTLARFDHRNIVKVHRYFEANGTAYIVMEYAEGETLSAFLSRKGTLDEAELKTILIPILDGLETVHSADFLHRDLKPGNIVLRDEDASPVLVDFGSARHAVSARSQSVTTIVTPGYAPIEQYSSRGNQGPWTDIYALGGVCYKALTGVTPVDAIDRLTEDPLVPLTERSEVSASHALKQSIDRALQVNEDDRPANVAAWIAAVSENAPAATENDHSVELKHSQNDLPSASKPFDWVRLASILIISFYLICLVIQDPFERAKANKEVPTFSLGSHLNEVLWLQGIPSETTYSQTDKGEIDVMTYTYPVRDEDYPDIRILYMSKVYIDYKTKTVVGWSQSGEYLRVSIEQGEHVTKSTHFTLGSHQDDVIRLHGTPRSVIRESDVINLTFGLTSLPKVSIDLRTRQVVGWWDSSSNLKVKMEPGAYTTGKPYFTSGSHQDDVVRLEGTPSRIEIDELREKWWYSDSGIVSINRSDRRVVGWTNKGGLTVQMVPGDHVTHSTHFTLGSHRDDVLRLQGTPDKVDIRVQDEIWTYTDSRWMFSDSWVLIDRSNDKVFGWNKSRIDDPYYDNILEYGWKVHEFWARLVPGNQVSHASYFTRGSHQDDVLRLQGTPSMVRPSSESQYELILGFGESRVNIDRRTEKVVRWDDASGNLKVGTQPGR